MLLMVVHNPFIFSVLIDALYSDSECQIGLLIFFSFHACLRILLALLCLRNVRTTVEKEMFFVVAVFFEEHPDVWLSLPCVVSLCSRN